MIGYIAQTMLECGKRKEVDDGQRDGLKTSEHKHIKALGCEVEKLRRANDNLKTANAFFARTELDRRMKS